MERGRQCINRVTCGTSKVGSTRCSIFILGMTTVSPAHRQYALTACSLLLTETGSSPRSRNCMTRVFMSSLVGDSVLSQQRDCSYQSIVAGETLLTYSRSLMNCSSFVITVPPDMGPNAPW